MCRFNGISKACFILTALFFGAIHHPLTSQAQGIEQFGRVYGAGYNLIIKIQKTSGDADHCRCVTFKQKKQIRALKKACEAGFKAAGIPPVACEAWYKNVTKDFCPQELCVHVIPRKEPYAHRAPPVPPPPQRGTGGDPHRHRAPPASPKLEWGIDRPGHDYRDFNLAEPLPNLCRASCEHDPRCRSWTFVKPNVQGPKARCWLKDSIPAKVANECCVSGIKK